MRLAENLDLTPFNSYRLKSIARLVHFPENMEDVRSFFAVHRASTARVIGGGNKIILGSTTFTSPFVVMGTSFARIRVDATTIQAQAGAPLRELSLVALRHGLSGLEVFYDIPGTLGGAIHMNAGAYEEDILSLVDRVEVYDLAQHTLTARTREDIRIGYRTSNLQDSSLVVMGATLRLHPASRRTICQKMRHFKALRDLRLPKELPNAGSVFKRPATGPSVGEMIEQLGLKGTRVGGVEISNKHGGFIVVVGDCHAADVLELAKLMANQVLKRFGVRLEMEQVLLTDDAPARPSDNWR